MRQQVTDYINEVNDYVLKSKQLRDTRWWLNDQVGLIWNQSGQKLSHLFQPPSADRSLSCLRYDQRWVE